MKVMYERLETILSEIEARNQRARTWLDKLIFRCHEDCKRDLDRFATAASIQSLNYDFEIVLLIQGDDTRQKPLYSQVERLLMEMESASELKDH
jgi:hypothetical protein